MKPKSVRVFEVGARDGLQNEPAMVSTELKLQLIRDLLAAGVQDLECGAFVRPDRVPQMADTETLLQTLGREKLPKAAKFWALVPNLKGLERALATSVKNIAIFTASTDGFNERNIGLKVSEHLKVLAEVVTQAKRHKLKVRGYVSTAFGCPFEGTVAPKKPIRVAEALWKMGVDEISIGDTIGVGTPNQIAPILKPLRRSIPLKKIAFHFHDTRGTALANALQALELGIQTLDSSAGGLGGCPFAPGATGNLATEDLVFMLHGMGIKTGIDLDRLCAASLRLAEKMNRPLSSRYLVAYKNQTIRAPRAS